MPVIQPILDIIATVTDAVGVFVFPLVIIFSLALTVFARYSFRCFRIVLPIAGVALGVYAGMSLSDFLVSIYAPEATFEVDPKYIIGIVLALILGAICVKLPDFTVLLAGAGIGYALIGPIVTGFLKLFPFVQAVESATDPAIVETVDMIVWLICMIVCAYLIRRFFKPIYLFATAIVPVVLAVVVPVVLILANSESLVTGTSIAAICGLALGAVCYGIQNYETMYY